MSDSLWPHGPQHTRPPCPSPNSGVYSNSCPLSRWCQPTISSSVAPSPPTLNLPQHQGVFKWVNPSHQVAKYWSFSFNISPTNEHPGLISFRMDWLDLLAGDEGSIPCLRYPTCCGETKSMLHNYWACTLQKSNCNYWSLYILKSMLHNKKSHCSEQAAHCNEDSAQLRIK